jgi:AcrR family transcriptional regulator
MNSEVKREHLLETAQMLFWKHGIKRISIEEICQAADVSKMTFYKHFKDKTDLVRTILETLGRRSFDRYSEIMESSMPYSEKVKAIIQMKLDQTRAVTQEFITDVHRNRDPEIQTLIERLTRESFERMELDFRKAQADGHLRPGIHPEFIMYFTAKIMEMSNDAALQRMYPTPQAMIMELMNIFFYGILPQPDGQADPKDAQ